MLDGCSTAAEVDDESFGKGNFECVEAEAEAVGHWVVIDLQHLFEVSLVLMRLLKTFVKHLFEFSLVEA